MYRYTCLCHHAVYLVPAKLRGKRQVLDALGPLSKTLGFVRSLPARAYKKEIPPQVRHWNMGVACMAVLLIRVKGVNYSSIEYVKLSSEGNLPFVFVEIHMDRCKLILCQREQREFGDWC